MKRAEIPAALAKLKTLDDELMVVGADVHKYELHPPLSEAEVAAWEAANCALPADYRAFLLEVGNGAPGPGEGLLPLGAEWDKGEPGQPWARGNLDGLLPLCRYPDGSGWDLLMVNGPQPGTVWNYQRGILDDWYNPDGSGLMTFTPWYTGWVLQMLQALDDE